MAKRKKSKARRKTKRGLGCGPGPGPVSGDCRFDRPLAGFRGFRGTGFRGLRGTVISVRRRSVGGLRGGLRGTPEEHMRTARRLSEEADTLLSRAHAARDAETRCDLAMQAVAMDGRAQAELSWTGARGAYAGSSQRLFAQAVDICRNRSSSKRGR